MNLYKHSELNFLPAPELRIYNWVGDSNNPVGSNIACRYPLHSSVPEFPYVGKLSALHDLNFS